MVYLSGEFPDRSSIIDALKKLQSSGVAADDLAVFSSEPLELPKGALARKSNMSLAVVAGAITFGLCVIAFVHYAQTSYPIVTGGMPIFSFWATGVVFYELTMLGAILMSLSWFLYESGLFKRRKSPVPIFAPGSICLRIHCSTDREPEFCRLMEASGGTNFKAEDEKL